VCKQFPCISTSIGIRDDKFLLSFAVEMNNSESFVLVMDPFTTLLYLLGREYIVLEYIL